MYWYCHRALNNIEWALGLPNKASLVNHDSNLHGDLALVRVSEPEALSHSSGHGYYWLFSALWNVLDKEDYNIDNLILTNLQRLKQ